MRAKAALLCATATLLIAGCSRESNDCPSGTEPYLVSKPRSTERLCRRANGEFHGPVVELDRQGHTRRIGQIVDGKKHGRWVSYADAPFRSVSEYREGQLERIEMFDTTGTLVMRASWRGGLAHGRWRSQHGAARVERTFRDGRRAGAWTRYGADGRVAETRVYDDRGILLSIDGRSVMPPRASLVVDGKLLEHDRCLLQAASEQTNRCLDLFESIQSCDSPACEQRALERYRQAPASANPLMF